MDVKSVPNINANVRDFMLRAVSLAPGRISSSKTWLSVSNCSLCTPSDLAVGAR